MTYQEPNDSTAEGGGGFMFNGRVLSSPPPPPEGTALPPINSNSPTQRHDRVSDSQLEESGGPNMPDDFYDGVEQLLNAPPPSLKKVIKKGKGKKGTSLTQLRQQRSEARKQLSNPNMQTRGFASASGGVGRKKTSKARGGGKESFDFDLLAQAMDYVAKIPQAEDIVGDMGEGNSDELSRGKQPLASGSPRQGSAVASLRRAQRKGGQRAYSAEEMSSSKQRHRRTNGRPTKSADGKMRSGKKNQNGKQRGGGGGGGGSKQWDNGTVGRASDLDVTEMVSNFENGTEIQRLRAQLAESQASLNGSQAVLKQAAIEYFDASK